MMNEDRFFIITGGPGAGKTTVLEELAKRDFYCEPEVARKIIQEQVVNKGDALPWMNRERYLQMMLERSVACFREAEKKNGGIIFFDRGIPDSLTYAGLIGQPISDAMDFSARHYRYHQKVFFLAPWPEIYTTDPERKQSWKEAVDTAARNAAMYCQYEYELIEVPFDLPEIRADFVLKHIQPSDERQPG